ncbi:expressed unknown protein [Seminavis robusta]|uniref:Uncharacterized protein n=1 Tax=Seminavis robusta TaxID=568900 RepID=A0A9N8F4U2_9STRA|nr:expressed unknown protein [Seminavis robusta]|eukprot:Sro3075_g343290.1 n/a (444) ;mRNA; r:3783-5114
MSQQRRRVSLISQGPEGRARANITASQWGISKPQFKEFVNEVFFYQRKGLFENVPLPHSSGRARQCSYYRYSSEKFNDPKIGPTIYHVTQQFIRPRTKGTFLGRFLRRRSIGHDGDGLDATEAPPNSSWALMKNPSGLDCDLFVCHSWSAGIFEFANHLLKAWPDDCHAAYICFLSNPQNLDAKCCYLGCVASNLQSNAFYKVLSSESMKQMIVITSLDAPIYQRAWCCFEVYLAMKQGLLITMGGDLSTLRQLVREYVNANNRTIHPSQPKLMPADQVTYQKHKAIVQTMTDLVALVVVLYAAISACLLVPVIILEDNLPRAVVAPFRAISDAFCGLVVSMLFPLIYVTQLVWSVVSWPRIFLDGSLRYIEQEVPIESDKEKRFPWDVRRAEASVQLDRMTILRAIGDDAELVNEMLADLVLNKTMDYRSPFLGREISFVAH